MIYDFFFPPKSPRSVIYLAILMAGEVYFTSPSLWRAQRWLASNTLAGFSFDLLLRDTLHASQDTRPLRPSAVYPVDLPCWHFVILSPRRVVFILNVVGHSSSSSIRYSLNTVLTLMASYTDNSSAIRQRTASNQVRRRIFFTSFSYIGVSRSQNV